MLLDRRRVGRTGCCRQIAAGDVGRRRVLPVLVLLGDLVRHPGQEVVAPLCGELAQPLEDKLSLLDGEGEVVRVADGSHQITLKTSGRNRDGLTLKNVASCAARTAGRG